MNLRAPTLADAEVAAELVIAGDVAELGSADYTLADLRQDWTATGFDVALDAALAERDGVAVGVAYLRDGKVYSSSADPEADVALLEWAEARAAALGLTKHQQYVGDNPRRRALLENRGYTRVRSYSRMERAVTGDEPAGFRPYDPADRHRLYVTMDAAFATVPDYEPETEARFAEDHLEAHDFDPRLSRVADHGFALVHRWEDGEAHIGLLAVDPAHTGHGLGTALLNAAFAAAAAAGLRTVSLGVASDNPRALGLYQRAGMTQRWRVDAYEKPVPH